MKFLFCLVSAFFLVAPFFPEWVHVFSFGFFLIIAFWWSWCEAFDEAFK